MRRRKSFREKLHWPYMSACHAELLADNRTPVGSVPRRELDTLDTDKYPGCFSFAFSLALSEGSYEGEEVALLAQLRLPLATRSKRISPDKRILVN